MACKAAVLSDEYVGYECEVTGDRCFYITPDEKRCAEEFGDGPGVESEDADEGY